MKLSFREKMGYGFGDLGNNFMFDLGQLYLLKFYTDVLGINPAIGGLVFLVSKIADAFVDTSVGTYLDSRTKIGKRGKFRPFILFGTVPLFLLTICTFLSPHLAGNGKVVWAFATYIIFNAAYSVVNIPYGSLAAAMTQDSVQRTSLSSFRMAGSYLGGLVTGMSTIPIVLMFSNPSVGYPVAIGIMGVCGMICHYICYKNVKEHIVVPRKPGEKVPFAKVFKSLLTNRPLIGVLLVFIFSIGTQFLKQAVQIYYLQYNLGDIKLISQLVFIVFIFQLLAILSAPGLTKKMGKKNVYILGLFISAGADLLNYFLPTSIINFDILWCIGTFGLSLGGAVSWAMISDCIEYNEWKTGERTEGIIYSTCSFARKVSQALAGFIPGIVLAAIGYVPNATQSAGTLAGIRQLMFLYPAMGTGITILVLLFIYNLSDKRYNEILGELNYKRGNKSTVA
ncbi:glycoside-pentoside-hexuronide (GPH):cation symporter [Metabacillus sp. RGM 3146]|uniref:glycoside-pentoside-hexuronide (GPH):cation symporter n=1 Tax=Metabacillus sp. RGM 3146 TaxID=3401092 RepID=UPI003B9AFB05